MRFAAHSAMTYRGQYRFTGNGEANVPALTPTFKFSIRHNYPIIFREGERSAWRAVYRVAVHAVVIAHHGLCAHAPTDIFYFLAVTNNCALSISSFFSAAALSKIARTESISASDKAPLFRA